MDKFRQAVIRYLAEATGLDENTIESMIEIPKEHNFGDFAFPCFALAKTMKKAPNAIAEDLKDKFQKTDLLDEIKAIGPYLNFFVKKDAFADSVLTEIFTQGENYGSSDDRKKVMLEFPSPNTNKPLHLGHVRLVVFGMALANILKKTGNEAIVVNLLNDRGIHICKSMLAYMKWGDGETPMSAGEKGDYFIGKYYVMFAKKAEEDPGLEKEAQTLLQRWESGDAEVRDLWKKMNAWSREGMDITLKRIGYNTQKDYLESEIYLDGKKLVLDGLDKGILKKDDDGNIYADLEEYSLSKKIILRADGTTIYSTQDIALAYHKYKDFEFDRSLYLVGTEQNFYLQQIFKIMEVLGFSWGRSCKHVRSGMIYLPHGRMKSREGTVVDADGLIDELIGLSREEICKRHPDLSEEEIKKRAEMIGLGAMRFFFLKYDPAKDFVFHPKESISFEGETGPYVQYTHARICSIIRKSEKTITENVDMSLLKEIEEKKLISHLATYKDIVSESAALLNPSRIARYLLDLSNYLMNSIITIKSTAKKKGSLTHDYCLSSVSATC